MKYKYELHCHTSPVSDCSRITVRNLVKEYINLGYNGIVLTNHINPCTFKNQQTSRWKDLMKYYLSDYYEALDAAKDKLTVLLGAEIRFYENSNDYLLYGVDEAFLNKYEAMMHLGVRRFSEIARDQGILLIQAHPFRNGMTLINPKLLDGIEVHNAHPRHDSRNDLAELWQKRYGLLYSAGSDTHEKSDISSGILTDIEIKDNKTLVEIIKTGNFEIIK